MGCYTASSLVREAGEKSTEKKGGILISLTFFVEQNGWCSKAIRTNACVFIVNRLINRGIKRDREMVSGRSILYTHTSTGNTPCRSSSRDIHIVEEEEVEEEEREGFSFYSPGCI